MRVFFRELKNKFKRNQERKRYEKHLQRKIDFYKGDFGFINSYDIIHFHDASSLYRAQRILENYKGKVILTSHCPKTSAQEEIEDNLGCDYNSFPKDLKEKFEEVDRYSFNRADHIMFPCPEAQEPYEEVKEIKEILERKKLEGKMLYVPTGIALKNIPEEKDFFQDKEIPENSMVISYIGRHNKVKGYQFLLEFGKRVLEKYPDVYFVIGGEINKELLPLENNRWIEYGWTNKGYNIIKNSDLFVLPNEKTYFDLILLEVMSMGAPVLLTETGGNRYFKKYEESGMFYFQKNSMEEALYKFDSIYKLWKDGDLKSYGENNFKIFNKDFTLKVFSENYIKMLDSIGEDNGGN
ncbi:MAG: glycosyltransferase family 4 protein [Cetobacterium sp.]